MSDLIETRLFINNEFRKAASGQSFTLRRSYDDSILAEDVQIAGEKDVDDAVNAALVAYRKWRKTPAQERAKCMNKLADLIDENLEWLAELETAAMGAPISATKWIASTMSNWWRYYAGWTDKIAGESLEDVDGTYRLIRYEPIGVCAGIASWNATLFYLCWKIAPAVAAGNTFVFKTSEKSPLGALRFASLVKCAGFPPGVINFVTGEGATGALLASHMDVRKISFTGSTAIGRKIQVAAANSNLKRVTLELGGKSAAIIFEDADLGNALTHMSRGFLLNSGQVCAATTRMLVHESIAENFVSQLKDQFRDFAKSLGDPTDPATFLGPIVDETQFQRVMSFLEIARQENLKVLAGGKRHNEKARFVEPTIILDPPIASPLYKDEIFGPVLVIKTFKTEAEAISLANDTVYGLGAAIFTGNVSRALRLSSELECGFVGVNMAVAPTAQTPFGGVKQSGYGREGGKQGLMAYLDAKTVAIAML
ncbi:aldehyde dehydrogenase [Periconia macrospinosa]|uniref:aldehyde dehydrogenase (NAD(+)) n=1 Tax=Periconia macrospinosa TaxID=97972 RepID=A0A2V1DY84_9PLEO|nr:aldehyde dehydrogenase [Periconia macrospinosa]